jgi:UPF0755 protein
MTALIKNPKYITVTIPEGYNLIQVAELFEGKNLAKKKEFLKLLTEGRFSFPFLKNVPMIKNRLECYIFTDTYYFEKNDTHVSMIKKFYNFESIQKVYLIELKIENNKCASMVERQS